MNSSPVNPMTCHGKTIPASSNLYHSQRAGTCYLFPLRHQKSNSWLPASRNLVIKEKIQLPQRIVISMSTHNQETIRPTYIDCKSIWDDTFNSFVWDHEVEDKYTREIGPLKEEVRAMLLAKTKNEQDKIHLINNLKRLGISYHYEKEIHEQLEKIFNLISGSEDINLYDLYNAALLFRILRQHGFDISSGIFNKFLDSCKNFREELTNDAKGLLSLYEASFLRRHGEDIMEEALNFTKDHLKRMAPHLDSAIGKQVNHALEHPPHRVWERTYTYYNICFYEEDEFKNDKLLKFAKLNFNLLQMLQKKELSELMRWWKPIAAKLDHARDRMVESYFVAIGHYFEPQYSLARIMVAKATMVNTLIDYTFDAYGTLEELKKFTDAVERWNVKEIDELPEYMKIVYKTLLDIHQEFDDEMKKSGRSYVVVYWKERTKELARAYYKEAKWVMEGSIPNFEEYLQVGIVTISPFPLILFGIESATREIFEWLKENSKIIYALGIVDRLLSDIATYKDDKAKGLITNGIDCYMNQYGVSEEEAIVKFYEIAEDAWKDINGEIHRASKVPMVFFNMALNYARVMNIFNNGDKNHFNRGEKALKPQFTFLLVNPLEL